MATQWLSRTPQYKTASPYSRRHIEDLWWKKIPGWILQHRTLSASSRTRTLDELQFPVILLSTKPRVTECKNKRQLVSFARKCKYWQLMNAMVFDSSGAKYQIKNIVTKEGWRKKMFADFHAERIGTYSKTELVRTIRVNDIQPTQVSRETIDKFFIVASAL